MKQDFRKRLNYGIRILTRLCRLVVLVKVSTSTQVKVAAAMICCHDQPIINGYIYVKLPPTTVFVIPRSLAAQNVITILYLLRK